LPRPLQKIGERSIFWHMKLYGQHGIGRVDVAAMLDFHRSHERIGPGGRRAPHLAIRRDEGGGRRGARVPRAAADSRALRQGRPLRPPAQYEGLWMGMDTYRKLSELNRPSASGEAPWKVWQE
jgi:hypothetical protein